MTRKLNCWEITDCGREPGGTKTEELGVCPAATDASCDGINDGGNAGRLCWAVAGSLCGGVIRGTFAAKYQQCSQCEVFRRVRIEEGRWGFVLLKPDQLNELRDFLSRRRRMRPGECVRRGAEQEVNAVCKTAA